MNLDFLKNLRLQEIFKQMGADFGQGGPNQPNETGGFSGMKFPKPSVISDDPRNGGITGNMSHQGFDPNTGMFTDNFGGPDPQQVPSFKLPMDNPIGAPRPISGPVRPAPSQIPDTTMPVHDIFAPKTSSIQDQMNELYKPEHDMSDLYNQHVKAMPERQTGQSKLRKISAVALAGLSDAFGRGGGKTAFDETMYPGFDNKMKDWEAQNDPLYKGANLERNTNVNERQMAYNTVSAQLRQEALDAKERKDDAAANLAERKLQFQQFKFNNPDVKFNYTGKTVTWADPRTGEIHDTGLETGKMSDMEKFDRRLQDAKTMEGVKQDNRIELKADENPLNTQRRRGNNATEFMTRFPQWADYIETDENGNFIRVNSTGKSGKMQELSPEELLKLNDVMLGNQPISVYGQGGSNNVRRQPQARPPQFGNTNVPPPTSIPGGWGAGPTPSPSKPAGPPVTPNTLATRPATPDEKSNATAILNAAKKKVTPETINIVIERMRAGKSGGAPNFNLPNENVTPKGSVSLGSPDMGVPDTKVPMNRMDFSNSIDLGNHAPPELATVPLKFKSEPVKFHESFNVNVPKITTNSTRRKSIGQYDDIITETARKYGVDSDLVHSLVKQESNYDASARSNKGAEGLMQLMPLIGKAFNVKNRIDPKQNVEGGVQFLSTLLKKYKGDIPTALAAYNAGEPKVDAWRKTRKSPDDYSGLPKETQNYIRRIMGNFQNRQEQH